MLNSPTLMLQQMDPINEENLGALYLDLASITSFRPRRRPDSHSKLQENGRYFGTFIVCDSIEYCIVHNISALHEEMIHAKKVWNLTKDA